MSPDTFRAVIVGSGPGGLEAALALRALAGDRVDVELVSPGSRFTYVSSSVAEPFRAAHAIPIDLERLAEAQGFGFTLGRLWAVDANDHLIATDERSISYDMLVLALGAFQVPAVPGALIFGGPQDGVGLRVALEQRCRRPGARIAFVANPTAQWPLPAYELALMTSVWAAEQGCRVEVALVSAESEPLEMFGPADSARIKALLAERDVALHAGVIARSHADGFLVTADESIAADFAVALPALIGPSVPGIRHDRHGFVPVDETCRVRGVDDVFAVGDMTSRTLKQGGLATQQADVAAAAIAAAAGVGCDTPTYVPDLRAVLLTGEEPLFLGGAAGAPDWPPHKFASRHLAPYLDAHAYVATTALPA